jgi:hypothetical protein
MRRVKLLRRPAAPARPLSLRDLAAEGEEKGREEMLYFRHRCGDEWFAELIEEQGLSGKKITPSRLRKLIVKALEKRRKEQR